MLKCLSNRSSASSSMPASPATFNLHAYPPFSLGSLMAGSPATSTQPSPTNNISRMYFLTVHSRSFNEMLSKIHILDPNSRNSHEAGQNQDQEQVGDMNGDEDPHQLLLSRVLQPNREHIEEALRHASPNTLTHLFFISFNQSEKATDLCLHLLRNIYLAQDLYAPILQLLDIFPHDHHSIAESQCNNAFEVLCQFECVDNPLRSYNFQEMHCCFSELKQNLEHKIQKSHSRVRFLHRATTCSAICIIGTAVAVTAAALGVAIHALVAIIAGPLCTANCPLVLTKKELVHVAQLDAARKGTYVLNKYMHTIDRLVARLSTAIEGDKRLVRLVLERGKDKHSIHEVVKQLRKNRHIFTDQIKDLKEHICLCFKTVNWARSILLQEIHLHQTHIP